LQCQQCRGLASASYHHHLLQSIRPWAWMDLAELLNELSASHYIQSALHEAHAPFHSWHQPFPPSKQKLCGVKEQKWGVINMYTDIHVKNSKTKITGFYFYTNLVWTGIIWHCKEQEQEQLRTRTKNNFIFSQIKSNNKKQR
jgi:hypothetical protein